MERDITSTLRLFAPGIYVGSQIDRVKGAVVVDVRSLPEHPATVGSIPKREVDRYVEAIARARKKGATVFVHCKYGLSRAPSVAKFYCWSEGIKFKWDGSFPNRIWREYAKMNFDYYHSLRRGIMKRSK